MRIMNCHVTSDINVQRIFAGERQYGKLQCVIGLRPCAHGGLREGVSITVT